MTAAPEIDPDAPLSFAERVSAVLAVSWLVALPLFLSLAGARLCASWCGW